MNQRWTEIENNFISFECETLQQAKNEMLNVNLF